MNLSMIIGYKKSERWFIYLYFATMTGLLMDLVDNFPLGGPLRKLKYLYILIMFIYMIWKHQFTKRQLLAASPLLLILIHTFLFGKIFVNPIVSSYTSKHVREILIFYAFVLVTFYYVSITNNFFLFVETSYLSLMCTMGFAAITHINNFVNPYYFRYIGDQAARVRNLFGFEHPGYIGNYGYCAIALSLILYHHYKKEKKYFYTRMLILFGAFSVLMMICSAAARSPLLATATTLFYYWWLETYSPKKYSRNEWFKYFIKLLLFVVVTTLLIIYFVSKCTRGLNIEGNMDAFHQLGNPLTGMGYVENHGFQEGMMVYGITTTSLDISYVYYYFTTGIVGCVLIFGAAALWLLMLILNKNKYKAVVLPIYISMLYYAQWQVNLFSYSYYSNLIYYVIYMALISDYYHGMVNNSFITIRLGKYSFFNG